MEISEVKGDARGNRDFLHAWRSDDLGGRPEHSGMRFKMDGDLRRRFVTLLAHEKLFATRERFPVEHRKRITCAVGPTSLGTAIRAFDLHEEAALHATARAN